MRPIADKPKQQKTPMEKVKKAEKFWRITLIILIIAVQVFFVVGLTMLFGGYGFFIGGIIVLAIDICIAGLIWFVLQDEINY